MTETKRMGSLLPSIGYRGPDDFSAPLYVTPTKAVWYHRHDGKVTFETRYDDAPALRAAELAREVEPLKPKTTLSKNMDLRKVASVPMAVYHQSIVQKWDRDDWKKWVNDPENKPLRVWQGRL